MLPGFPMTSGGLALSQITLTAGTNGTQPGYVQAGWGSLSAQPIAGVSLKNLFDNAATNLEIQFTGDVRALLTNITKVTIGTTLIAIAGWQYDSGLDITYPNPNSLAVYGFVNGNSYSVLFG